MRQTEVKRPPKRESWNPNLNIPVDVALYMGGTAMPKIEDLPYNKRTPVKLGGLELIKARILHVRLRWGEHIFNMNGDKITYHCSTQEDGELVHYLFLYHGNHHFKLRFNAESFAWTLVGYDDRETS